MKNGPYAFELSLICSQNDQTHKYIGQIWIVTFQEIKMIREDDDTGYLPRLNCSDKEGQDREIRCPMNFLARQLTMSPH